MSDHPTDFKGDILQAIRDAVAAKIEQAQIEVTGGGDATPKTVSFPGAYTRKSHPPVLSFNAVFFVV